MSDCCSKFEEILFEPEEDLSPADSLSLARHIEQCPACRAERELFLDSWSALDEIEPEIEPSPLIRAKVWERIREEEKAPPLLIEPETAESFSSLVNKVVLAGLALVIGFGFGRAIRPEPAAPQIVATPQTVASESQSQQEFIDPAMIELASQEGFSVEIFPESTEFTPLDQDMRTALATSDEERVWLQKDRGVVVPVQHISQVQGGTAP